MTNLRPWLQIVRAGTLFSPAADALAGACLVAASTRTELWSPDLVRLLIASSLIYAGGMACNDAADVDEDRVQRPERPIPRGAITRTAALSFGLLLLGSGVLVSPVPWHHGVLAIITLLYDFAAKRVLLLGAMCMAGLRALNLGVAASLWHFPPSVSLISVCSCYAVYIFAVTILGSFEEDRTVRPRAVAALQGAPMWATLGGLIAVQDGLWPAPAIALAPILWLARRNRRIATWGQQEIRGSMSYLLLGTMIFTGLIALAAGRPIECCGIVACIPLARLVTRSLRAATLT